MRRHGTGIVVAAVLAVALAAVLDGMRTVPGVPPPAGPRADPAPAADPAPPFAAGSRTLGTRLRAVGILGVLTVSDGDCRVWTIRLPALSVAPRTPARAPACAFSLAPRGSLLFPGRWAWEPRGRQAATCFGGSVVVFAARGGFLYRVRGCGPAWTPDGTLTYVGDGALRRVARRDDVVLSRAELVRALRARFRTAAELALREVAWLTPTRFAAIVDAGSARPDLLAVFERRRLVALRPVSARLSDLEASPGGGFLAVRADHGRVTGVAAFDRDLRPLALPAPPAGLRALAWSPDERWIALASSERVVLVPARRPSSPAVRLPLAARHLAWR